MTRRDLYVVGASAGGLEVLKTFFNDIPEGFPGTIFVVIHLPSSFKSNLPEIITRSGNLNAFHAVSGEKFLRGRVYVCPPGVHLLLRKDGSIDLSAGPKINGFRPSIDALFRSAAEAFGERVVGIVFSGMLDDGTAGLGFIKDHGGVTIVQDPEEAVFSDMPLSAIHDNVKIDHILRVKEITKLVKKLAAGKSVTPKPRKTSSVEPELEMHPPLVCPQCGGVLTKENRNYVCRIGHRFSQTSLEKSYGEMLEEVLWRCIRIMKDISYLYRDRAVVSRGKNPGLSSLYDRKSQILLENANTVNGFLLDEIRSRNLEPETPSK